MLCVARLVAVALVCLAIASSFEASLAAAEGVTIGYCYDKKDCKGTQSGLVEGKSQVKNCQSVAPSEAQVPVSACRDRCGGDCDTQQFNCMSNGPYKCVSGYVPG